MILSGNSFPNFFSVLIFWASRISEEFSGKYYLNVNMNDEDDLEIVEILGGKRREKVPMSQSRRSRLAQRSLAIDRIKKCRKVGYELHKKHVGRPYTPYIDDPNFDDNFYAWKKAVERRNHSEITSIR